MSDRVIPNGLTFNRCPNCGKTMKCMTPAVMDGATYRCECGCVGHEDFFGGFHITIEGSARITKKRYWLFALPFLGGIRLPNQKNLNDFIGMGAFVGDFDDIKEAEKSRPSNCDGYEIWDMFAFECVEKSNYGELT